jgi:hypothetical protein
MLNGFNGKTYTIVRKALIHFELAGQWGFHPKTPVASVLIDPCYSARFFDDTRKHRLILKDNFGIEN